jgi:hypothetical protein
MNLRSRHAGQALPDEMCVVVSSAFMAGAINGGYEAAFCLSENVDAWKKPSSQRSSMQCCQGSDASAGP